MTILKMFLDGEWRDILAVNPDNKAEVFTERSGWYDKPGIFYMSTEDTLSRIKLKVEPGGTLYQFFRGGLSSSIFDADGHDFENAVSVAQMFMNTGELSVKGTFNIPNATSAASMFESSHITQFGDDVIFISSNVEDMRRMFYWSHLQEFDGTGIDTSKVTTMVDMFRANIDGPLRIVENLKIPDTLSVNGLSTMFYDNLGNIERLLLDTRDAKTLRGIFESSDLTHFDASMVTSTSNVEDMRRMFYWSHLQEFDGTGIDTSKVTTMVDMFRANIDGPLRVVENLKIPDTLSVNGLSTMFYDNLGNIERLLLDTRDAKTLRGIFESSDLTHFDASMVTSTSNVEDMSRMFYWSHLQEFDGTGIDTSKVTTMVDMFRANIDGPLRVVENLKIPDTLSVNGLSTMFYDNLGNIERLLLDTRDAKTLRGIFESSDLTHFDASMVTSTSNVEDMGRMFYGNLSIETVDFTGLDTSNVKSISNMFSSAFANQRALKTFIMTDATNVTDVSNAFYYTNNLETLELHGLGASNLIGSERLDVSTTGLDASGLEHMAETLAYTLVTPWQLRYNKDIEWDTSIAALKGWILDPV